MNFRSLGEQKARSFLSAAIARTSSHKNDRAVFTAIVYVLTTGCAWGHLPAESGVSKATAHRRFVAWIEAELWWRLHRALLDRLGDKAAIDWSRSFDKPLART